MFQLMKRSSRAHALLPQSTPWEAAQEPERVLHNFLNTAFQKDENFVFTVGFYRSPAKAQLSLSILGDHESLLMRDHHSHDEVYHLSEEACEKLQQEVEALMGGPAPTVGAEGFWVLSQDAAADLLRVLFITC